MSTMLLIGRSPADFQFRAQPIGTWADGYVFNSARGIEGAFAVRDDANAAVAATVFGSAISGRRAVFPVSAAISRASPT